MPRAWPWGEPDKEGIMRLKDKVAVVTGAAGVLCSVFCETLLAEGARVALLDLREEAARGLQERLAAKGLDRTLVAAADVLDRTSLEAARARVLAEWGRIDILVNGAGGNHPKGTCRAEQATPATPRADGFFGLDIAGFEFVNRLNFIGTLLPSQVFGEAMAGTGGSIVNISSMAATLPVSRVAAYGAAKASVENFTRWLAVHLAPLGIRVNAIAPGFFLTEHNRFLLLEQDGATLTPRGRKVIAKTPMGRFGDPRELGCALTFLASEEAAFVTGIVVPVDGGFLANPAV
jgi:NAD(P)-dependent dehydrogenase (short-subunit alcohol dehydrogenase family)